MKLIVQIVALIILLPSLGQASEKHTAEVLHFWVWPSERIALQVLIDAFEDNGGEWTDTPIENGWEAKVAALSRIRDNNPPTAVQWHVGKQIRELYRQGMLHDLQGLAGREKWEQSLPSLLWRHATVQGKMVTVPLAMHGANWLWANARVLEDCQVPLPGSWDEFFAIAPRISEKGYIPFAMGGQPWQQAFVFLSMALAIGGVDFYMDAFDRADPEVLASPTMAEVFKTFGRLRPLVDKAHADRSWGDTTALVLEGKAAFQIMGDWVKGEVLKSGNRIGEQILCAAAPGTGNHYIAVPDSFAMVAVKEQEHIKAQQILARTIMDPELQHRFSLLKGSLPARMDTPLAGFDQCAQRALAVIRSGDDSIVPGLDMIDQEVVAASLMDSVAAYWNNPDAVPAVAAARLAATVVNSSF